MAATSDEAGSEHAPAYVPRQQLPDRLDYSPLIRVSWGWYWTNYHVMPDLRLVP